MSDETFKPMVTIDHLFRGLQLASMTIQGLATGEVTRHQGAAKVVLRSYTFLPLQPLHHLESLFIFIYPSLQYNQNCLWGKLCMLGWNWRCYMWFWRQCETVKEGHVSFCVYCFMMFHENHLVLQVVVFCPWRKVISFRAVKFVTDPADQFWLWHRLRSPVSCASMELSMFNVTLGPHNLHLSLLIAIQMDLSCQETPYLYLYKLASPYFWSIRLLDIFWAPCNSPKESWLHWSRGQRIEIRFLGRRRLSTPGHLRHTGGYAQCFGGDGLWHLPPGEEESGRQGKTLWPGIVCS